MTPERYQQIGELCETALELEPGERAAFLDRACAGDEALRQEVESLLAADEQAGNFIAVPALELAAGMMAEQQPRTMAGERIGHYRVLSLLGKGGMGEVYLAEDTRLRRKVALKLLPGYFTADEQRVRRFRQEAQAASALNHPNIITIHDIGEVDGRHYIATEYVEGETLRQVMAGRRMNLGEALDVAVQVASALTAAHQAGIMHRDIKPENIMLRPDGIVKVVDFGLAKLTARRLTAVEAEATTQAKLETTPGTVMGTTRYMSPEQARGLEVDARTDIFSLGVVIYEMVAGRPPFEGRTVADVIASKLAREPAPLARYAPSVPAGLESVVSKALRKRRQERYQTAEELLGDLRELREELQIQAKLGRSARPSGEQTITRTAEGELVNTREAAGVATTSATESPISLISRSKGGASVALAAIAIAMTVTSVYLWRSGRPKAADGAAIRSIAVLPFKPLIPNDDDLSLGLGLADDLVIRLSQTRHIIVRPTNAVLRFAGKEQDPVAVGRALAVDAVLTGTVRRSDERIRVSVQFIRVEDGASLWADRFDEKFTDVFTAQDRISEQLSRAMALELSGEEKGALTKRYTSDAQAFELYMKARSHWRKATREGYNICIDYLEQALRKDPHYALAWAGLAGAYAGQSVFGFAPPKESMPRAEAMAKKAAALDETLAIPHASLAVVKMFYDWNPADAEREFQRAIELDPNFLEAHHYYALCLAVMGRFAESRDQLQVARQLDPGSPSIESSAAWVSYLSLRQDEAIAQCRKAIEIDPNFFLLHLQLGQAYVAKQTYDAAIAAYQKARILSGNAPVTVARLGHAYAAAGRRREAAELLGELRESGAQPHYIAWLYIGLGDRERALEWLEKAYEYRAGDLIYLKSDPIYDPLRRDPRLDGLLRRVGLMPRAVS